MKSVKSKRPPHYLGHRLYPPSNSAYGRYSDGRCDCGSFNTSHRYRTAGDHAMYAICLDCGWQEPEKIPSPNRIRAAKLRWARK